jgi:hypothetical protein
MPSETISSGAPIERVEPSTNTRKVVAFAIRTIGFLLGAAAASLYVILMWSSPPDFSTVHRISTVIGLFLVTPILLFFGPFWLADRLAAFVDKRRVT